MGDGNVAWMLVSTALVVFMVPGLALFYGGMVRAKNVGNMLMMNMACIAIVPILWVLFTYSLGNEGDGTLLGGFDKIGLDGMTGEDLIGVAFLMDLTWTPRSRLWTRAFKSVDSTRAPIRSFPFVDEAKPKPHHRPKRPGAVRSRSRSGLASPSPFRMS